MEAEALLDALANTPGEIKAEMILPGSGWCGDQGTYQHDKPKFSRGGGWGIWQHAGWQSSRGEGPESWGDTDGCEGRITIFNPGCVASNGEKPRRMEKHWATWRPRHWYMLADTLSQVVAKCWDQYPATLPKQAWSVIGGKTEHVFLHKPSPQSFLLGYS